MSIAAPWFLLMVTEAWRYGIKAPNGPQWPEPSRFILGSVAMGFAAVIAQFNSRIGGLLAWGLLIGAIVQQSGPNKVKVSDVTQPTTPPSAAMRRQTPT